MDTIRYFQDRAHTELEDLRSSGDASFSLEQVQDQVAHRAGYSSWQQMLSAELSDLELAAAMDQEPWLTTHGLGPHRHEHQEKPFDFARARTALRAKHDIVEVIHYWLLLHIDCSNTIDATTSSCLLKSLAEHALKTHFTHGEVIAAAIIAGYPYHRGDQHSSHAIFAMSPSSIDRLQNSSGV